MVDNDINVTISESTPINVTISESNPINVTIDSVIGSSSFIGLIDTPNDYVGSALKYFRVNSSANAIEFVNDSDIEITWGNIVGDISNQNDLQSVLDLKYNSSSFNSDFDTRFGIKTTTDLNEGINLYYTQSRFDNAFGLKNTDDLTEGLTNFYDKIVSLTAGVGISVSGTYPNFTITNTGEANIFIAGNGIDIVESPDDTFTFSVDESDLSLSNFGEKSHTSLTDIGSNSHTQIDSDLSRLENTSGTNTGDQDLSGLLPNSHLTDFVHSDIAHTNRSSLDLVSGTNTGDQVLPTRDSLGLDTDDTVTFANLSGTNTGDQDLSGFVPYTGATSDVDLGANSITTKEYISNVDNILLYRNIDFKPTGIDNIGIGDYVFGNIDYMDKTWAGGFSGNGNISIGNSSCINLISGEENIALGNWSLYSNNMDSYNIGIGYFAGGTTPTSAFNYSKKSIYIGGNTKGGRISSDGTTENEIVIGDSAIGNKSNTVTIGNDNITHTYLKGVVTASNLSGTNTGDQDLSGLVSLDQTTPQSVINGSISVITPTSDYHIATKKYVDDAIVAAIDDSWDGSY